MEHPVDAHVFSSSVWSLSLGRPSDNSYHCWQNVDEDKKFVWCNRLAPPSRTILLRKLYYTL